VTGVSVRAVEVVILPSLDEAGEIVARRVARLVAQKPDAVLGLATGSSPLPLYRALQRRVREGLDLSRVRGFALDEYVGLSPDDPRSYAATIDREVTRPLGLDPARVRVPDGAAADLRAAAEEYERAIAAAGGIDLQVLGIGTMGHLGFNEPGSSLASRTRVKTLTPQTRQDNARFFDEDGEPPIHCITQGLGTILEARSLVLFAAGEGKAAAVAAAVEGGVSAACPASVIQLHPSATVYLDEAAAGRLTLADYYRHTYEHKPDWQRDT
jgi:glucosamine-6-phosphate deaminase